MSPMALMSLTALMNLMGPKNLMGPMNSMSLATSGAAAAGCLASRSRCSGAQGLGVRELGDRTRGRKITQSELSLG
jgi:hypothetical protein